MANIFQKTPSKLNEPINKVLTRMEGLEPDSEEYKKLLTTLDKLMELQREEQSSPVNPDTLVTVAGSLLGILIIVAYEQKHVMVSKALGMVLRSK
jgi:hypothetical protein